MGRPVLIKMAYCDPVRLSEEQADEYETVLHLDPGGFSHTVRLHVSLSLTLSTEQRS